MNRLSLKLLIKKRTETLAACFRIKRKDIYVVRAVILSHFRYIKEW